MPTRLITDLRKAEDFLKNGITDHPKHPDLWDVTICLAAANDDAVTRITKAFTSISFFAAAKQPFSRQPGTSKKLLPNNLKIMLPNATITDKSMDSIAQLLMNYPFLPKGLQIDLNNFQGTTQTASITLALLMSPNLPENLSINLASAHTANSINYSPSVANMFLHSKCLRNGFTIHLSADAGSVEIIRLLCQNSHLPERLKIYFHHHTETHPNGYNPALFAFGQRIAHAFENGMQQGNIKYGTRIYIMDNYYSTRNIGTDFQCKINNLCTQNDRSKAWMCFPNESTFSEPTFTEQNTERAASIVGLSRLWGHHPLLNRGVDDMFFDVLSYGLGRPDDEGFFERPLPGTTYSRTKDNEPLEISSQEDDE